MSSLTRRRALLTLLGTTALVACQTGTTPTVTPATVVSLGQSIVNGLAAAAANPAVTAAINAIKGGSSALGTITSILSLAQGALATFTTATPVTTGASIAQTIDGYINAVLDTADSPPLIGLIPAPFSDAVTAAAVLLPGLETFINQYLPASVTTASAALHHAPTIRAKGNMSPDQAAAVMARLAH